MNEIILHGSLKEQFGESFKMACRDPIDAYKGLAVQLPGFRDAIRVGQFTIVREMPNGAFALNEEMLFLGMENCKLHFLPNIDGDANKGGAKLILGIAVIGASFFIPGGAMIGTMAIQTLGIMTGAAMALGGLALMLAPTPKLATGDGDNKDSVLFSGDVNPSGQNLAISVGFGLFRVPGIPVATQIVTNQQSSGENNLSDFYSNVGGAGGSFYYQNEAQN